MNCFEDRLQYVLCGRKEEVFGNFLRKEKVGEGRVNLGKY